MYVFSRTRLARPERMLDAMQSSVEIAQKASEISGIGIYVWSARFGAPLGTMSWSCRVDSQADFHTAGEKLTVDPSYLEMAQALSDHYQGPAEDALMRVVSGTPSDSPSKFYMVTTAAMAGGRYTEAVAWSVGMQEYVSDALGRPGMFGTRTYGGFADVGWLLGFESMAEVDEAADWEASTTEYHERLAAGSDLFIDGSGHQMLIERLN
ncbi:MAG: hypothetical protein AAGD33_14130 [Actinomycetota bacterium]